MALYNALLGQGGGVTPPSAESKGWTKLLSVGRNTTVFKKIDDALANTKSINLSTFGLDDITDNNKFAIVVKGNNTSDYWYSVVQSAVNPGVRTSSYDGSISITNKTLTVTPPICYTEIVDRGSVCGVPAYEVYYMGEVKEVITLPKMLEAVRSYGLDTAGATVSLTTTKDCVAILYGVNGFRTLNNDITITGVNDTVIKKGSSGSSYYAKLAVSNVTSGTTLTVSCGGSGNHNVGIILLENELLNSYINIGSDKFELKANTYCVDSESTSSYLTYIFNVNISGSATGYLYSAI